MKKMARRVGFRRRRVAEHPAQVDEVFLASRSLTEIGPIPLRD